MESQQQTQHHQKDSLSESAVVATNSTSSPDGAAVSACVNMSAASDSSGTTPSNSTPQQRLTIGEHLQSKINRTKEAIKVEQTARDENVNEYLKLASNADKGQLARIKSVFEKKNQKSAQTISHLQKKLENYTKRIKELETYGYSALQQQHHRRPKEMLRDMGQNLKGVGTNVKDGITGLSSGVIGGIKNGLSVATHTAGDYGRFAIDATFGSAPEPKHFNNAVIKPKEFFRNRFGSADNISGTDKSVEDASGDHDTVEGNSKFYHSSSNFAQSHSRSHSTKYTSDDESSSITSGSAKHTGTPGDGAGTSSVSPVKHHHAHSAESGAHARDSLPRGTMPIIDLNPVIVELRERRDEVSRLTEELESLKTQLQAECTLFHQSLQDERYRFERLEEQMNDLIELHQNEIENLKQGIADMEEKVQYQSEERLRDVHEMLESCQTRISRMEHQQHQHLQQLVNLDSLENSNARALVLKLINVVLTILQVVLLLVATIANILTPFLHSRARMFITFIVVTLAIVFFQQWTEVFNLAATRLTDRFPTIYTFFTRGTG